QEGILRRDLGDAAGAEAAWQAVLRNPPGQHFASVHAGLRGHLTRHFLATLYKEQGRLAEAEDQWRQAAAIQPDYGPAREGLGEAGRAQRNWDGLEEVARELERVDRPTPAAVLRAHGHLARQEFADARRLLHAAIAREPQAVRPRLVLAYTWLQER